MPDLARTTTGATGSRAFVTGSGSGIGAAIVRRLAGPGVSICLHVRKSREACERVAEEARAKGATAWVLVGDLEQEGEAERLTSQAIDAMGGLDILVANAGFASDTPFGQLTRGDLRRSYEVIEATFFGMVTTALPHLQRQGARVLAISSLAAHVFRTTYPYYPASAAAKAATETLVRALALQLAPFGATANCIAPGLIEKDGSAHRVHNAEKDTAMVKQIPVGRKGRPDEIAAMAAFLCSRDAAYITGQVIHVNGGLT